MDFGLHLNTSSIINLTLVHGFEASSPVSIRMHLMIITGAITKAL
jgi:hypothetical protein